LRQFLSKRHMDLRVSGCEHGEFRAKMPHQALTRKAFADAAFEFGILCCKLGLFLHAARVYQRTATLRWGGKTSRV